MDAINPDHYKKKPVETIEKMVRIWGARRVAEYCEINAFKYRERAGLKGTDPLEDINKALWYEAKMQELLTPNFIKGMSLEDTIKAIGLTKQQP